jgi:hypothetical protein
MKTFFDRLKIYAIGFGIGMVFVFFFFQNRGCSWLPDNRVKNSILDRVIVVQSEVELQLKKKGINKNQIIALLNDGDVDFSKSKKDGQFKIYLVSKDDVKLYFTLPNESFISEVRLANVAVNNIKNSKKGTGKLIHFPKDNELVFADTTKLVTCQQQAFGMIENRKILKSLKENAYKKIIPGAYKCDLWRYCVLYIYGGFYADIDTLCMGKLNSLTNKNIEFIVPIDLNINPREGQHNLACGFIGSVPKSPILLDAIDRIVFNVENNIIPTSKLDFSGPGLLGRAVNKFLNLDETSSFKGNEGIRNNINFLEFDPNTEYMKDVYTDSTILQNKNIYLVLRELMIFLVRKYLGFIMNLFMVEKD